MVVAAGGSMDGAGADMETWGLGNRNNRLVPEKVSMVNSEKMVMVACGWRHTISVSSSGRLYTYGWSKYGQLGHGDFKDHLVPHKLEALSDKFICKFGQVGVGDNIDPCSPVRVKFPHEQKVVQISCGWRHTLAVTEGQNVFSKNGNAIDKMERIVLIRPRNHVSER